MTCGCSKTYIVNEDYRFSSSRRKKDKSFKSFIGVMLVVLLVYLIIYCLMLTLDRKKESNQQESRTESLNNEHRTADALTKSITPSTSNEHSSITSQHTTDINVHATHDAYSTSTLRNSEATFKESESDEEFSDVTSSHQQKEPTENIENTTKASLDSPSSINIQLKVEQTTVQISKSNEEEDEVTLAHKITTFPTTHKNNFVVEETTPTSNPKNNKETTLTENYLVVTTKVLATNNTLKIDEIGKTEIDSTQEITTISEPSATTKASFGIFKDNFQETTTTVNTMTTQSKTVNDNTTTNHLTNASFVQTQIERTEMDKHSLDDIQEIPPISELSPTTQVDFVTVSDSFQKSAIVDAMTTKKKVVTNDRTTTKTKDFQKSSTVAAMTTHRKVLEDQSMSSTTEKATSNNNIFDQKTVQFCETPQCKQTASDILHRIEFSTFPCENFYQYACGRAKANDIEQHRIDILLNAIISLGNNKGDEHFEVFKGFYRDCVEYQTDKGIRAKFKQVLESHILQDNLTVLLGFIMKRQVTPLFQLRYGYVNEQEGYGLQILPPNDLQDAPILKGWSLSSYIKKHCYRMDNALKVDLQSVYEDYKSCQIRTFKQMMSDQDDTDVTDILLRAQFTPEIDIQRSLFEGHFRKTTVNELERKYNLIDWEVLLKQLVEGTNNTTPVYIYLEKEFLEGLLNEIKAINASRIINALKHYYLSQMIENMLSQKSDEVHYCMNQVIDFMPEIAENIFIKRLHLFKGIEGVKRAFEEITDGFFRLLDSTKLLRDNDRNLLNDALNEISLEFQADKHYENELVKTYFGQLNASDYMKKLFVFLDQKMKRTDFNSEKYFLMYHRRQFPKVSSHSTMVVPNMFLYKLMRTAQTSSYLYETYLKFHLAKAIALHLTDQARKRQIKFFEDFQTSLNANLEYMMSEHQVQWEKQTINIAQEAKVTNYSTYERTADNLALQVTYSSIFTDTHQQTEAFNWISNGHSLKSQFFIFIVQDHCQPIGLPELAQNFYESSSMPSLFRMNGLMSDSPYFSSSFSCNQGTKMNPPEKTIFNTFSNDYEDDLSVNK